MSFKHPQNKGNGSIRIIGGQHKGRKLPVIDLEGLRPTTDRIKETLFNWLMFSIRDKKCLDLFSGAGSLGFEAISRYAQNVTMIEKDKKAFLNLKKSAEILKCNNATILNQCALEFLKTTQESFDIIFIDPPFRKDILKDVFKLLTPTIAPEGTIVYIENETENQTEIPNHFHLLKENSAGQVTYRLYEIKYS
jgi:16S rRNA (guanine966-N2)-methyltransferase